MTAQNQPSVYAKAIQYQLKSIVNPVPVYANFNRNFQNEPSDSYPYNNHDHAAIF